MRLLLKALAPLTALSLSSCMSAVPIARDVEMVLAGGVGGHLYPPVEYIQDIDALRTGVSVEYAPGHEVGPRCALYGNFLDMFVAECVKPMTDGSIVMILPNCPKFSTFYCEVAERHGWGHVYQARNGKPMDHKGWGRFESP